MTTIDAETFKRAMCRVFDLPWDARNNDYDQTDPLSVSFIEEGFMRAEILYELTESDITICKSTHRWSQVTTTRFLKLLGWLHESRRTTGHWNDLLKETITSRVLTPSAGSPTAAGNRSFGDFSSASGGDSNKTKDIKIDYKSLTELKNDRKFCSFYIEFQTRMRGARLGYFWSDDFTAPACTDPAFAEYEYHCNIVMSALSYCCKTPMSKLIVRKHMKNGAASVCLAELETAFMDGMTRKLDLRAAETEWREFTLEPSYNKSLVTWLVSWAAKEAEYCDHAEDVDLLTDSSKRQILERAICKHPDFEQAVASVLLDEAKTKTPMEYSKFWDYLNNYALQVDSRKGSTKNDKRQANQAAQKIKVKTAESTPNGSNNAGRGGGGRGRGDQSFGGRGRGRGDSGGRGAGGRGVQWTPNYAVTQTINVPADVNQTIPPTQWRLLTRDQQDEVRRRRESREVNTTAQQSVPAAPASTTRAVNATSTNVVPTDEATTATASTARVNNAVRGSAMRNFLSSNQPASASNVTSRHAHIAERREYKVASLDLDKHSASTIDRGASGGVWGADGRVLTEDKFHKIEVTGVGGLKLPDLSTVTAVAKLKSTKGWVVGEFHNYAYTGTGKTIHSSMQMEAFGLHVNDKHFMFGGKLRIETPDGYKFMLGMESGMATLPMFPVTNSDLRKLPRVMMTSDGLWDPSKFDVKAFDDDSDSDEDDESSSSDDNDDDDSVPDLEPHSYDSDGGEDSDDDGDFTPVRRTRSATKVAFSNVGHDDEPVYSEQELNVCAAIQKYTADLVYQPLKSVLPKKPDIEALLPNFAWFPTQTVIDTLQHSTQFNMHERRYPPRLHRKSRFANVWRIDDRLAHDTMFFDEEAMDDHIAGHAGCTTVQLFYGCRSHLIVVYPMRSKADVPKRFRDFIREFGAPMEVFSDNAKEAISEEFEEVMREFMIHYRHTSEPHFQNQNPAERIIGHVKEWHERLMDRTGTPACFWLRALLFLTEMSRHMSHPTLEGKSPIEFITGRVPDVSKYLHFRWFEIVNYHVKDIEAPRTRQRAAYWLGPNLTCGDDLTYFICDCETHEIMTRSVVLKRNDPKFLNLRVPAPVSPVSKEGEPRLYTVPGLGGEILMPKMLEKISAADDGDEDSSDTADPEDEDDVPEHSNRDEDFDTDDEEDAPVIPNINPWLIGKLPKYAPDQLIGKSFLIKTGDGQEVRATVSRKLDTLDAQNHQNVKMLLKIGNNEAEEVMSYVEVADLYDQEVQRDTEDSNRLWFFKEILDHKGPLTSKSKGWKGSKWNVLVQWDDGSKTWEPLNDMIEADKVTVAAYAQKKNLLGTDGWKSLKNRWARNAKKVARKVQTARMAHQQTGPRYKFGVQVPRNWKEARRLQEAAGHTKWTDAEAVELANLDEYETFQDLGVGVQPPGDYQRIRVHFVYDVKHDLRYKARLVAGGHLTQDVGAEDAYSSVISLKSMRLALAVGEANGKVPMVGDIGNAYLEAFTKEKVYFIAGPEFGEREGHTLVIVKALYGLRTSGARFHERLSDALRDEGWQPSYCDPDLWIRDAGDSYDYVCVWVDDLLCIATDAAEFFKVLETKYHFKLKGVGHPEYHLGGDFGRDPDGTLYWSAKTYGTKLLAQYERLFEGPPKKYSSPMDKDDHPEIDQSELLDEKGKKIYQSLIGALQWAITLARFDISVAVTSLSRFRAEPRQGHLKRVQRVCGYLREQPDAAIRFRVQWPANEEHFGEMEEHDWQHSVYGTDAVDEALDVYPPPKGRIMRTSTFEDASLMHCLVTGKSLEGVLSFVNQTPVEWYCKLQSTVETATFGSEFGVAKTATDQAISLRASLMAMGVPLEKSAWMFGDNQSVITQSTIPSSTLTKRHNALAYHRVRWAVAAGIIKFIKIDGKENIADVLTKFLPYCDAMPLLKPVLFWRGDASNAFVKAELKKEEASATSGAPEGSDKFACEQSQSLGHEAALDSRVRHASP
jgi:hypothetical protein